jgi:uncharacterized membrane protein YqhA
MNRSSGRLETAFETILFNLRIITLLGVVGSMVSSILMFLHGTLQIYVAAVHFIHNPLASGNEHSSEHLSVALIASVDTFLFATVLLIFAMGLYELFISRIDPASRTADSRPNWLAIHSLDDLKGAVGKVILMILIVRLFEAAVKMTYSEPIHLLWLAVAVVFVSIALFLVHAGHSTHAKSGDATASH